MNKDIVLIGDDARSMLYFQYERLLAEIRVCNPTVWFLLENVRMKQEYKDVISERLCVQPIAINSSLVSAQNRYRLYWTNIVGVEAPEDCEIYLKDILQEEVDEKYFIKDGRLKWLQNFGEIKSKGGYVAFNPNSVFPVRECGRRFTAEGVRCDSDKSAPVQRFLEVSNMDKSHCLTTVQKDTLILQWPHGTNQGGCALDGKTPLMTVSSWEANNLLLNKGVVRKLTPTECERLQTVPDGYTSSVSDSQRYRMLGNGWTVDVIVHILKSMFK